VVPVFRGSPPGWFRPDRCPMMGDMIVQYDRGGHGRAWDAASDPPFYTANLALGVKAVRKLGGFDERLGHRGASALGGEDSELIQRIDRAGGRGWYVAGAIVYHPVPAERLTRRYARRFAWRQGYNSVWMHMIEHGRPHVPPWFYRVAAEKWLAGLGQWLGGWLRLSPNRAFAGSMALWFNAAKLVYALRRGRGRPR
jgi:GT2 family glycosyltransferase